VFVIQKNIIQKYYFNTFSRNNMKTCIKMLNNKIKIETDTSNDEQLKTILELMREIKRGRGYY
jgi:hypothetical protein